MIIKKLVCLSLATILCIFGAPLQVLSEPPSANLVGTVLNTAADPVPGIEIIAKDPTGKPVGQSVTDKEGQYVLKKLPVGKYGLKLDPIQTGYQGATVVTPLTVEGLTVNWTVSTTAAAVAIAAATPNIAPAKQQFFALGSTGKMITAAVFALGPAVGMGVASAVSSDSQ